MVLSVRVHCGYPSYAESGEGWNNLDWDAFKLVKALKGKPINGYATVRRLSGQSVRITADNTGPAFEVFGEWGARTVQDHGPARGLIVPVPAADCLALSQDPKGRRLADAIAIGLPTFQVVDALHWDVEHPKASEGGPRDFATLFGNLRVHTGLRPSHVVLVDDVMTGGGHLRACAEGLRAFGHQVELAICAARTVHSHPETGIFNLPPVDLEATPLAGAA